MNIPWMAVETLAFPASAHPVPGGEVAMRAETDLVVASSACPQDILPIDGRGIVPVEAHSRIA